MAAAGVTLGAITTVHILVSLEYSILDEMTFHFDKEMVYLSRITLSIMRLEFDARPSFAHTSPIKQHVSKDPRPIIHHLSWRIYRLCGIAS